MPVGYVKMRDKFEKQMKGKNKHKRAQKKAAKYWNAKHPENPVGRGR